MYRLITQPNLLSSGSSSKHGGRRFRPCRGLIAIISKTTDAKVPYQEGGYMFLLEVFR